MDIVYPDVYKDVITFSEIIVSNDDIKQNNPKLMALNLNIIRRSSHYDLFSYRHKLEITENICAFECICVNIFFSRQNGWR